MNVEFVDPQIEPKMKEIIDTQNLIRQSGYSDGPNPNPLNVKVQVIKRCKACKALIEYRVLEGDYKYQIKTQDCKCIKTLRKPLKINRGVQPVVHYPFPARNEPCYCGSKIKFKHCCMKKGTVI